MRLIGQSDKDVVGGDRFRPGILSAMFDKFFVLQGGRGDGDAPVPVDFIAKRSPTDIDKIAYGPSSLYLMEYRSMDGSLFGKGNLTARADFKPPSAGFIFHGVPFDSTASSLHKKGVIACFVSPAGGILVQIGFHIEITADSCVRQDGENNGKRRHQMIAKMFRVESDGVSTMVSRGIP